jgi:uncharacterized BrkB/YihY/UPF0761 family membrane protein
LLVLGGLLSLAPLGSVLSVRYVPLASMALHQWLTPFALLFVLLYLVFRRIPRLRISRRAAAVGASCAAVVLATAKLAFGIYAQAAVSLHALWGAIAFVPLFLVWILLCWYAVLSAGAVAAVVHGELTFREAVEVARRDRPRRRRSRLRQRMLARPSQRAPSLTASPSTDARARPPSDARARPPTDAPARPPTDAPARPPTDAPARRRP